MDFGDAAYQAFLAQLRRLSFHEVRKVLKRRDDLIALTDKNGFRIMCEDPSFGAAYDSLRTDAERQKAKLEYRYFCGFTEGDIFFRKSAQHKKQLHFLPIINVPDFFHGVPELGDYLMGEIENSPDGGRRFAWWCRAHKQDYAFVQVVLGQTSYSAEKLERKLTVEYQGFRDRRLYLYAKALHFRDADYFVRAQRDGERIFGNSGESVFSWLQRSLEFIAPEFVHIVERSVGQRLANPAVSVNAHSVGMPASV